MIAAFIPARGGSKGIPHKNLAELGGRPLLAWSIQAALDSRCEQVVVSTDCPVIAAIAQEYGATIHKRPERLATDAAQIEPAICHWLDGASRVSTVILLQPTSPLRPAGIIDQCLGKLAEWDSVFTGRIVEGYTWTVTDDSDTPVPGYHTRFNRQDRRWWTIEENGSVYAFTARGMSRTRKRLHGSVAWVPMGPIESLQIDHEYDLELLRGIVDADAILHR